jgi:hypothetical protein
MSLCYYYVILHSLVCFILIGIFPRYYGEDFMITKPAPLGDHPDPSNRSRLPIFLEGLMCNIPRFYQILGENFRYCFA